MLRAFRGKKLIVVERRPSLTAACHAQLTAAGATVAGPVSSVEQVLNLLEAGDVDGAIIDVKVDVTLSHATGINGDAVRFRIFHRCELGRLRF